MAGKNNDTNMPMVHCSFCGKTEKQVHKLIAGPNGVYICDECIDLCDEILAEEFQDDFDTPEEETEINLLKPKEIKAFLDEYVVGQEYAKKVMSVGGIHRENKIERDDFLGNLDEAELYDRPVRKPTFQMCGVSVNEDPMQLIKALHIPNPGRPTLGIVRGIMKCQYGPADFQEGKTHHNWYLFKDKIDSASSEFKIIEVDELCQKNIGTKSGE